MTTAISIFFDTGHLPEFAMLAISALAFARVFAHGLARHWPILLITLVSCAACATKLVDPVLWTPLVYVLFEGSVALFACDIGFHRSRGKMLTFAVAFPFVILAVLQAPYCNAYVALAVADLCSVSLLIRAQPRDRLEAIARWGLGFLLAFQAARAALFGVDERLALAVGQGGWAVFCLAFFLIAREASQHGERP